MAYHIDVTGISGNITQIQYDRLKADADSYVILRTNDGVVRQLNFALERANVLLYSKIHGQNSMIVEVNPNLSYNFRTETIETTENKTETITADSTTTEYPTAKTAFEYINSVVGISTYLLTVDASNINQNPSNPTKILSFGSVQLKFTAKQGYYLPDDVTVTNATSVWDKLTGTLTISKPTGDVSITISGVAITYSISTSLTNVNAVAGNATSIKTDETKVLTFTAEPGYSLPATVKVQNATGIWDKNSGSLVLTKPTGSVTITLVGTLTVYSIIIVASHITQVSGNPTTITKGQTRVLRFNTVTGYNYPNSVTVTGAASSSWEKSTGTLTLVGGTGNISVNIAGSPQAYSITTNLTNVTANASNPKVIYRDSSVELKFTANDGYELPASIPTVTNVGSQSWNKTTGKLNLYNPTGSVTVTISGVMIGIEKYTSPQELSVARTDLAAENTTKYAMFFGGKIADGSATNAIDLYDAALTKTIKSLSVSARYGLKATRPSKGTYSFFAGGETSSGKAYNFISVISENAILYIAKTFELTGGGLGLGATNLPDYALFAGGENGLTVDCFTGSSLTKTIVPDLSVASRYMGAGCVSSGYTGYALFAGGWIAASNTTVKNVDAYDRFLTKSLPLELSIGRSDIVSAGIGDNFEYSYTLFAGGLKDHTNSSSLSDAVDVYDRSLTRGVPLSLSRARAYSSAGPIKSHAIIYGGNIGLVANDTVDAYDMSLTRSIPESLSTGKFASAATIIGDYALCGGGSTKASIFASATPTNTVDTYTTFVADPIFENNSWATIAKVFKSGQASQFWSVGDTKKITAFGGVQYTIRIADMQTGRYDYADGSGSSKGVFEFVECVNRLGQTAFSMNSTRTNAGGFASSHLRNADLQNIFSDLPDDMQAAISEVNVLSGTGSGTTSGTSSSANKLFLPAEMEMFDAKHYSIGLEECPLGQFDYYKAHNTNADRKKTRGSTNTYWLRSSYANSSATFCSINNIGSQDGTLADDEIGVAPIFAI